LKQAQDQLEKIGGGECTPGDIVSIIGNLTQAYEVWWTSRRT
jgi:hypothetical protein